MFYCLILFQTAQRELSEECGLGLKVTFLSSAPSAHLTYKHSARDGVSGSKVTTLYSRGNK